VLGRMLELPSRAAAALRSDGALLDRPMAL
jgi:hypothetical protein